MAIQDKIRVEKLQYHINREATKISAFLSSKTDKYEYLIGKEIIPSNQNQMIEQAKFTYFFFRKGFSKTTKESRTLNSKRNQTITKRC